MRVSHVKGVLLTGTCTPSARAGELTHAAHMQADPVRVTVRFSNASTDPQSNDAAVGEPRGMSVKFYLPDGSTTDRVCQSWPVFVVSTPQEFVDFMHAQIDSPEAVGAFSLRIRRQLLRSNRSRRWPLPRSAGRPWRSTPAWPTG